MDLVIDRSKWYRGKVEGSKLIREEDGMKCCLGFLGEACRIPNSALLGIGRPLKIVEENDVPTTGIHPAWDKLLGESGDINSLCFAIIQTNDGRMDEVTREIILKQLFLNLGVNVNFIGGSGA